MSAIRVSTSFSWLTSHFLYCVLKASNFLSAKGVQPKVVQTLISVQALVFDLEQLTCQKGFDCRNAILRSSAIFLGTSYSQIVGAVLL